MQRVTIVDGTPGATAKYVASDVAQSLPAAVTAVAGRISLGVLITVELYAVRIAFGNAVPTQGSSPDLGHVLNPGDIMKITGSTLLSTLQYINANNGENSVLQITPLYMS